MTVFDQTTDKSQAVLYQAIEKLADRKFADRVKDMVGQVQGRVEKTASAPRFADPEGKRFPVHTMEDAVLSKVYFDHQRTKLAEYQEAAISDRLDTFLNLYEVPESVFDRKIEKQAEAPAGRYLLPSLQLCKVASEIDMAKAADLFIRQHRNLNVSQRVEFAQNFIKAAADLGCEEYPEDIAKYAGVLDTDMENLNAMLEIRAAAATRKGMAGEMYTKLAFDLRQVEEKPSREELSKLAEVIHGLDEEHGFTDPVYDRKMPCAYSTVFNKKAEDAAAVEEPVPSKAEIVAQYGDGALEAVEDEDGNIDMEKLKELRSTYGAV